MHEHARTQAHAHTCTLTQTHTFVMSPPTTHYQIKKNFWLHFLLQLPLHFSPFHSNVPQKNCHLDHLSLCLYDVPIGHFIKTAHLKGLEIATSEGQFQCLCYLTPLRQLTTSSSFTCFLHLALGSCLHLVFLLPNWDLLLCLQATSSPLPWSHPALTPLVILFCDWLSNIYTWVTPRYISPG